MCVFIINIVDFSGDMPQAPGLYDEDGRFTFVKELVPEFVVPDLKNFPVCTAIIHINYCTYMYTYIVLHYLSFYFAV